MQLKLKPTSKDQSAIIAGSSIERRTAASTHLQDFAIIFSLMNPTQSTNVWQHEESRSVEIKNEEQNAHSISRTRTEEEKQRRRREWQRQQERERQHEKLKQQKILEYERRRAQALGYAEPKPLDRSRSKSSSKSPSQYRHREKSTTNTSKSGTLFEKLDGSTSGTVPLFKGLEDIQISTTELRQIKVNVHRNIPTKGPIPELQRSILNAEEVVVKRREGEGSKPIFDRKELKEAAKINKVEDRHTDVAIDGEQSVSISKPQTFKKHSSSLSPTYSSRYLSSHQSRFKLIHNNYRFLKIRFLLHFRRSSIEKYREYKDKYTKRDAHKYNINRSRSRERESRKSHSRSLIEEKSYRDRSSDRSSERFRERRDRDTDRDKDRDRDRSRERRDVAPHYIEPPIHVPIYYNLPPRPIVVSSMVPFRGQVPPMGRGRHSALMAPVRPFPPRFIPPDMYRLGPPPPNSRYGPF
ncbi:uncharacterized protein [Polyergus mexicanus]|uniref:uncharacterized protein n=1 Tax=Polyergus mexicanus TaxID=615972 RepID=UPI0038B4D496